MAYLVVDLDETRIDAVFAHLEQCHLPGVAVGVALHGRPVYRKGFGLANMELPVVLSPATRMRIGSVTKHFAAFAYMLLCEEALAGVDDPLGKHLPEVHPVARAVTMRQLMGHTSGLRDASDIRFRFGGFEGRSVSCAELLALYRTLDTVDTPAGTSWMYNNGGYMLVSAVIERITGQPLEQVLHDRIFGPLGMDDTLLRRWDTDFVPNSATSHTLTPDGVFEKRYWGLDFSGAGGMVSSVDDLLLWLAHMDKPSIGTAKTWAAMKEPQSLINGTSTGYGLGLIVGRYRGLGTLHHGGGWIGGNAQMLKAPAAGLDIVIIANRSDAFAPVLANQIIDACVPDLEPPEEGVKGPVQTEAFTLLRMGRPRGGVLPSLVGAPPSRSGVLPSGKFPERLAATDYITGSFRSPTTNRVIQLFGKDERQIVSIDGHDLPYALCADKALRPIPIWSFIQRVVTFKGGFKQPAALELNDFGTLDELIPIKPIEKADIAEIAGRYRSEAAATDVTIYSAEEGPRMRTQCSFGSMEYTLECLTDGVWRANSSLSIFLDCVITFETEGALFRLSSYNTRLLPFRRCS